MSLDVWTPMLTSNPNICNKSLRARNKVAHAELLQGLCCDMLWLWPVRTNNAGYKNIFCPPKNRAKHRTKNITTTFGKSLFLTQYHMRYTIYIPPNTKDLAKKLTMVAYENQQNTITYRRAINSDLLRALKPGLKTVNETPHWSKFLARRLLRLTKI